MTKAQAVSPLQAIVNSAALKKAEAQYRFANLFTPYSFDPERVDFDRVASLLAHPTKAFPQPSETVKSSLDRIGATLAEQSAILDAFKAQGTEPTLTDDQLFTTARNNVVGNRLNTTAHQAA
jgi:hypothetical protein